MSDALDVYTSPSFPRRRESTQETVQPHRPRAWIPACAGMTVYRHAFFKQKPAPALINIAQAAIKNIAFGGSL